MNFLFPQFLFGLFALSIPIIVHLFNFRRAKKLYFSNVQFLETVKQTSSSKLRIKHLLVLLARLLFVTFLVLAFAQPFIPGKEQGLSNKEVYLYLDNSLSMSNQVGGEVTAIDQAYNYLSTIIDLYPRDTRYKLLTNDFAPFSNTLKGKEEVQELTTEIGLSNISRSLDEVMGRLDMKSVGSANARDLYFVTDFQKSTLGSLQNFTDSANNYYVLPVQYPLVGNVYVDSVYLKDPFLTGDRGNELIVKIQNSGESDVTDLVVKFFMEDAQIATASVNLGPQSSAELSFDLSLEITGNQKCRLSFEEFPVAFDNDHYFILSRSERINVLEIKSEKAGDAITKVFGNEQLFNLSSYNANNLDYSAINQADLIVLNELQSINQTLLPAFDQYLAKRGDLFIVPHSEVDSISYQSLLSFLPFSIPELTERQKLASINPRNPYYEGIFEKANESFDMSEANSSLTWSPSAGDLINYRNGRPYLSRFDRLGTIYLVGSPLNDEFTGFHKHALFVPVMYRAGVLSKKSVNRLSFSLDESVISLKLDSLSGNVIYQLRRDSEEIIPNQRITGDQLILDLPKFILRSGFYELMGNGKIMAVLAFNNSKSESKLDQWTSEEEIKSVFSSVTNLDVFQFDDAKDFSIAMKERYEGINLWKYALVLALIFMLSEVLLLRFL